ncbi:MAG: nucleoside-diphosphate sugar epimerase/dehydratase [Candidatus Neomarinimicrobiota bacterium]
MYNTRATLSRFDEIIRLLPIIYSVLVLFIVAHIFGLINMVIDYKEVLIYGLVFSAILIVNRFIIHTIQKLLLNKKIGLKNALILGVNRRGAEIFNNLQDQPLHGLNVKGFIQAYDDPIQYNINNLNINKLGNEADIESIIKFEKIEDVIIALDKPTLKGL